MTQELNLTKWKTLPAAEKISAELSTARSMDDFFGREGIFARLFARTLEEMLEAELTEHLGYERHEVRGRNSGNNRNGSYKKTVRTSTGQTVINVPRDRNGTYGPQVVPKYGSNTNELEEKILGLYAKGVSTRDIEDTLKELYGVSASPGTISAVTDKVKGEVQAWQNRPLEAIYPIIFLDALHLSIRRNGKVSNTAVYVVLGVNTQGYRDILGHWIGEGGEGANFWLSVVTDLQSRGVQDVFISCVDGLNGFKEAIHAVFPKTIVQRCIIHQIRSCLKYVASKDQKPFMRDLKAVYKAATREEAELNLLKLGENWGDKYAIAVRSWENNWSELAAFFDFPAEIRRVIYTTNSIEGYNRQLRKVTKTKGCFPSADSASKLLYLAQRNVIKKWTRPIPNWAKILNQLVIRFEDRMPI